MTIWWLVLILVAIGSSGIAFIWLAVRLNNNALPGKDPNASLEDAANRDVEHIFNEAFREELRNRGRLHFEKFEISTSGDPFTAQLAESKKKIEVNGEQTLLDALREAGLDVPSSCEAGNCGTCRVGVKGGRIEHRGTGLTEDEKCSSMLSCVSRGIGDIVLEL